MLSVGVIGPAAGGEEIQTAIHRNTKNDLPHGWRYQIQNDFILNYTLTYEHCLLQLGQVLDITAYSGGQQALTATNCFWG
jgi:hypothetical protein